MRTKSEELFEQFCAHNGLAFRRVNTGPSSTPDYEVTTDDGHVVVVEVKQLDRDEEHLVDGEVRVHTTVPGEHIRRKINKAGRQLRTRAMNGEPTILLVYNNIYPGICIYSEPYDFLVAMYGLQNILLGLPHTRVPYIKGERFGIGGATRHSVAPDGEVLRGLPNAGESARFGGDSQTRNCLRAFADDA